MFEDVCFTCSRPVDGGRAYCSRECSNQEAASANPTAHLTLSPLFPAANRKDPRSSIALTLQNTRPDYALPLALIRAPKSRSRSTSRKLQLQHQQSQPQPQQQHPPVHHLRKRSSLSSSSTSSALSTPSAPALTDDDDSMSEPDFTLDSMVESANLHPTLSYARRPSATNTRSTIAPNPSSSSSASASASTSTCTSASSSAIGSRSQTSESEQDEHDEGVIPALRRSLHSHHRSVPTAALVNEIDKLFSVGKHEVDLQVDFMRPHSYRHPRDAGCFSDDDDDHKKNILSCAGLEANNASLSKLSIATFRGAETIRQPKTRRAQAQKHSRGSLPAYLSLMKISSSGLSGNSTPPRPLSPTDRQHKTSPTVAHSHNSSSIATLSATASTTSTVVMTHSLRGDKRSSVQLDVHQQTQLQQEVPPQPRDLHETSPDEPSLSAATSAEVASTGSDPKGIAITSKAPTPNEWKVPTYYVDAICECGEECSGTPRGRTRSRSTRPRSRGRSRTRERARRAHFCGASPSFGLAQNDLRGHNAVAAGMNRGRPHMRGMGMRGRRSRKEATPSDADVEDDVRAVHLGFAPPGMANGAGAVSSAEIDWLDLGETELDAHAGRAAGRTAAVRCFAAHF